MQCPQCKRVYASDMEFCPADGMRLDPTVSGEGDVVTEPNDGGQPPPRPETPADQDPIVGTVLEGRYEIVERIGRGGMGAVYRARQATVGRDVAVKILNVEATSRDTIIDRFRTEARIISQLRHPNTLKLFDSGRAPDGRLYIVTELLQGLPLDELLRKGPLTPLRVVRMLRQVCGSLAEAHDQGIIHRDLKPGNLFVEEVGGQELVKVLDFGIARVTMQPSKTATGTVFGTPAYMSPEQARGERVDARCDLYSTGIIAYECLAGRIPFVDENPMTVMLKHIMEPPPPMVEIRPELDLPHALVDLVTRLLEKKPDKRPDSVEALRAELERIEPLLASVVDTSTPSGPVWAPLPASSPSNAPPPATDQVSAPVSALADLPLETNGAVGAYRRRQRWMIAAMVLALGVALVVAGWWWQSYKQRKVAFSPLAPAAVTPEPPPEPTPVAAPAVAPARAEPVVETKAAAPATPKPQPPRERRAAKSQVKRPPKPRPAPKSARRTPAPATAPPSTSPAPEADGEPDVVEEMAEWGFRTSVFDEGGEGADAEEASDSAEGE